MSDIIRKYRSAQRRIRRLFDPYTEELCPACPKPCCRKPTKVRDFDVLLANACGCSLPMPKTEEPVEAGIRALTGQVPEEIEPEPCDYLGPAGCVFPEDLRPFECVRYVCPFLKRALSPSDLRPLLHRLGVLRREIQDVASPK